MSVAAGIAARNCDARVRRLWRLKKSSRAENPAPKTQLTPHYASASNRFIETAAALRRLGPPKTWTTQPSVHSRAPASLGRRYRISRDVIKFKTHWQGLLAAVRSG